MALRLVQYEQVYPHFRGEWESILVKIPLSTLDLDSNLDLPVISSLVYRESSVLDHAATEAETLQVAIWRESKCDPQNLLRGPFGVTLSNEKHKSKVNDVEMRYLGNVCGKTRMDSQLNEWVLKEGGMKGNPIGQCERSSLCGFGHIEGMCVDRVTKQIYEGRNMPFKYRNKFQMTLIHTLFWGSGLAAPMLLIRYILWRRRQT
ncbi:unnamed protein product [Timema podura]|uniref:Uncharacterized protein n=1 Tax=Timema podura TaxID=61482 RepID=A0ABN7NZV1_TIMPD|nr:unnamed protein product [Timema podura]